MPIKEFGNLRETTMTTAQHDSTPTTVQRSFARVAHIALSMPADLASALWRDPTQLVTGGEVLQAKGARRTVQLEWQSQSYVLKHYIEPTRRHTVKQLFEPSRAWTTWSFAHRLADSGVATPRPVACVENRWGVLRRDSFLVYPYIEGRTLRSYFTTEAKQSRTLFDQLWSQLNELWQTLVDLRVSLGDTNLGNFIVSPAGQLWLIDLDKSRFHRAPAAAAPHQQRAWNQLLRSAAKC